MENWRKVVSTLFKQRFDEVTFEQGVDDDGTEELYVFIDEMPAKKTGFFVKMLQKYSITIYSSQLLADSIALRITEKKK